MLQYERERWFVGAVVIIMLILGIATGVRSDVSLVWKAIIALSFVVTPLGTVMHRSRYGH